MTKGKPDLSAAYALKTPEDSRRLYADWAEFYDAGFADAEDYQLHIHTARAFIEAGGQGPVLDVGAGTGLCGTVLAKLGATPVDATDISVEMLAAAMRKDVYRDAIEADLTQGLPVPPSSYRGIVSSGTFTTGHVGPDVFDTILRAARPGAIFALSINAKHYASAGFEAKFAAMKDKITNLILTETRIYGDKGTSAHKDDTAVIATFEKT